EVGEQHKGLLVRIGVAGRRAHGASRRRRGRGCSHDRHRRGRYQPAPASNGPCRCAHRHRTRVLRRAGVAGTALADVNWHSLRRSANTRGVCLSRGTGVALGMTLDERKLDVLRAIVEDYVETQEPVGSKALVERHQLQVSTATVRNDMAVLEEEGYIRQPHTSAGRVPTDKGYRLFVDQMSRIKPATPAERPATQRFLFGSAGLADVVHRTVRLLAQLTRQVAVVQYPSLQRSRVRHLELVPISTTRVMFVMITDTGRVEQRLVELPGPTPAESIIELRQVLNEHLGGRWLTDTPGIVTNMPDQVRPELRAPLASLASVLLETLVERTEERIALAGTANLTRGGLLDFSGSLRPILEALEEEVILLKLFGQIEQTATRVRIGDENEIEDLRATSV